MPAVTPYIVEPGSTYEGFATTQQSFINTECIWERGSFRYAALVRQDISSFITFATFSKTSNGTTPGSFSPPLDLASAPSLGFGGDLMICHRRIGEDTVSFYEAQSVGVNSWTALGIGVFDLASETYLSQTPVSGPSVVGLFEPLQFVKFSDGSYGLFYLDIVAFHISGNGIFLYFVPYNSIGAIGTPVFVDSILSTHILGNTDRLDFGSAVVDSRDMVHFHYSTTVLATSPSDFNFFYNNILANTLGTRATIISWNSPTPFTMDAGSPARGYFNAAQDKVFLPALVAAHNPGNLPTITAGSWPHDYGIVVIDNATTAPSLNREGVADVNYASPYQNVWPTMFTNAAETIFYYAVQQQGIGPPPGSPPHQFALYCRAATAVVFPWTGPTIWWNYVAHPPGTSGANMDSTFVPMQAIPIQEDTGIAWAFCMTNPSRFSDPNLFYMEGPNNNPCAGPIVVIRPGAPEKIVRRGAMGFRI